MQSKEFHITYLQSDIKHPQSHIFYRIFQVTYLSEFIFHRKIKILSSHNHIFVLLIKVSLPEIKITQ